MSKLAWAGGVAEAASLQPTPASLPIGACINLGNHFETRSGGEHAGKLLDDGDFANIRAAGFDTVRMPVNWRKQSDPNSPHTIDPKWLARVTAMVDSAQAHGLNVILDNHNFFVDDPNAVSADSINWLTAIWKQLARFYARKSSKHLWFELHNEPGGPIDNQNLMQILAPSLAEIRKVSRTRPVIIGGEHSSRVESLATLKLPNDPNVWPTFHYYEPYMFTHQGATWGRGKPPPLGRIYGLPGDKQRLQADLQLVRAYIDRTGKVPFIGEIGAYDTSPLPQRVAYVGAMHKAFSTMDVPQCYWAYTNSFPFYDHKAKMWLPGMLEAIGLHDPGPAKTVPGAVDATTGK